MIELDEKQVALFIEKLRKLDLDASVDVIDVILASFRSDRKEPAAEIAKTLCEILEPERIGGLKFLTCWKCGARLENGQTSGDDWSRICTGCL